MFKKPVQKTQLDEAIDLATRALAGYEPHSEEYAKTVEQLTALNAIREDTHTDRLSKDTLALILGNLAGIVVIVAYEHSHVITSKALSFLTKSK